MRSDQDVAQATSRRASSFLPAVAKVAAAVLAACAVFASVSEPSDQDDQQQARHQQQVAQYLKASQKDPSYLGKLSDGSQLYRTPPSPPMSRYGYGNIGLMLLSPSGAQVRMANVLANDLQFSDGYLLVQDRDVVRAIDVKTGKLQWSRKREKDRRYQALGGVLVVSVLPPVQHQSQVYRLTDGQAATWSLPAGARASAEADEHTLIADRSDGSKIYFDTRTGSTQSPLLWLAAQNA